MESSWFKSHCYAQLALGLNHFMRLHVTFRSSWKQRWLLLTSGEWGYLLASGSKLALRHPIADQKNWDYLSSFGINTSVKAPINWNVRKFGQLLLFMKIIFLRHNQPMTSSKSETLLINSLLEKSHAYGLIHTMYAVNETKCTQISRFI